MVHRIPFGCVLAARGLLAKHLTSRSCHHYRISNNLLHRVSSTCLKQPSLRQNSYSTDIDISETAELSFLRGWATEDQSSSFDGYLLARDCENARSILYPNDQSDPHLKAITQATTIKEVFEHLIEGSLNEKHASQAIATLWDLQKFYVGWRTSVCQAPFEDSVNDFLQVVKNEKKFWQIVKIVDQSALLLTDEAVATVLLGFKRLQIPPWDLHLHNLMCASLSRINEFPLAALTKWCLAVSQPNNAGRLILPAALPAFHNYMKQCQSIDEWKMLSVCFITISPLVDKLGGTACEYVARISQLLDNGTLNKETPVSHLTKILSVLFPLAKNNNASSVTTGRILCILQDSPHLEDPFAKTYFDCIRKSWETVGEPVGLLRRLEELACRWLEDVDVRVEHLELLNSISNFASVDRKKRLEHHLGQILENEGPARLEPYIKQIFRIIRSSKISDRKIVDSFWHKVLKCLEAKQQSEEFMPLLVDTVHSYMFFNNNLGGTYRSQSLECQVLDWITSRVQNGNFRQPVANVRIFCRLSAFVLAYGGYPAPAGLVDKLVELEDQLGNQDVFYLSRGAQLGRHWLRRSKMPLWQRDLNDLTVMLDRRTSFLLAANLPAGLSQTTSLLHAILFRSSPAQLAMEDSMTLYEAGLKKCEEQLDELNARIARDIIYFLDRFRSLPTNIVDRLITYAFDRHEHLTPNILVNILVLCYNLGYTPASIEKLAPCAAQSIDTTGHTIYGLLVLEAALALLLVNQLPLKLVNEIFSVNFLDKLDAEVAASYSKATYPSRVRRTLMELNRGVCIDMPEAGVPWFHEKYCQEQTHLYPPIETSFHTDVQQCLAHILGNNNLIKSHTYSPYYHLIDFELRMNSKGDFIPVPRNGAKAEEDFEKVAVQALSPSSFIGTHGNVSGLYLLSHRQLEVLGYRVVVVPHHHWNSLALSNSQAKCNYLMHKLYRKSSKNE